MARSSVSKIFFGIFPPPAFIDMPYAGIDISETAIHCIEFKKSSRKGNLIISRHASLLLPAGIVEAGYVKDEIALSSAISQVVKKIGVVRVHASLPEEKSYLFRMPISSFDPEDIDQEIESKIEENVPLAPGHAIFNSEIISNQETPSVAVSVVPAKVVDVYLRVFKEAGVSVSSFVTKANALALALVPRGSTETIIAVYSSSSTPLYKKIEICIISRGVVLFTLAIPVETNGEESLNNGLKNIMAYWSDHSGGPEGSGKVDKVIVCGNPALIRDAEIAARDLHVPVVTANVWVNAFSTSKYIPSISAEESHSYAVAIGLALPK